MVGTFAENLHGNGLVMAMVSFRSNEVNELGGLAEVHAGRAQCLVAMDIYLIREHQAQSEQSCRSNIIVLVASTRMCLLGCTQVQCP